MPSLNQQQFLELLGIPFTGEGCDAVADFSGIDTMTIDVTTLTPSDCIAIFECILDNGTLAQFNELLSKFDFANLSAEQCTAIAQCIVDTPAAITLITQNIDFTNLTATQVSNLNELIDFSNLSPAECTAVFQCIIDNGTPAQFTELLQKLDMSQLTAAQCVDILDCILVNGTPVQWTELLSKLDLSDLTPVQCQAVFQCILDNGTAIQYTQFLSNINFAQLSTQQCQDIFNCIILNGTTEQFTQLFNKLDFTDLSEQQCRDALQCVIDNGTPAQFNELLNIFNMANLTEAQCSDIAACIAASPNALLLIRNAILPIEASEVSVVDSGNNYTGTNVETILAEIAQRLTGVAHTTISSIDLAPTGNANEFTVSITWIDSDGNTQVTSDPTPIQVTAANVAVNYNLLTAAECQTIFQCILDNGTVAQFIELLQKLDMSQLTAVQCQAIATCITDNPAALTIINNAIDSGNVTTFSSTLSDYDLLAFPPNQPVNPPAGASSGDTLIQRYGNGYGYFTFNGTTWDLNLFDSKDNQVFTHRDETGADYVNGSLNGPQNPPANPGQGDVHAELYDNALVFFSYQAAGPGAGWDGNNITYVPLDGGVFDASTLTAAQCQTIFQCLLDNGAPAQFTELLQKFDMTDLTTAQCNALANLLISGNAGNILELGPDGKLLVNIDDIHDSRILSTNFTLQSTVPGDKVVTRTYIWTGNSAAQGTVSIPASGDPSTERWWVINDSSNGTDLVIDASAVSNGFATNAPTVIPPGCKADISYDEFGEEAHVHLYCQNIGQSSLPQFICEANGSSSVLFDFGTGLNVAHNNSPAGSPAGAEYYLMYTAEDRSTRFSASPPTYPLPAQKLAQVYLLNGDWYYQMNDNGIANHIQFTPLATDLLIASTRPASQDFDVNGNQNNPAFLISTPFSSDGNVGGIATVANYGGLTVNDGQLILAGGPIADAEEMYVTGLLNSPSTGVCYTLQPDGTYLGDDGSTLPASTVINNPTQYNSQDLGGTPGTSAKTRQIDCYQSMGVSGVFEDNTDNPEIGTILYAQGIYLSGVTDLLGAMQVLVRNNGPELVDETFFFRDEDTGVVVGTSQPFNVPAGDNVITICFEPAIALSNAVEYDGDFSSAPNSNLVIPHNGTSPNGIISNETGDPAPIALLANECLNSLFTVITCTDGSQQAFDSAGASVDVAVATSGTLKASTAAAVNATGNPLIDAELSDFQSATPTTTAAGDNTVVSATSLREVLRVHNASATEVGVGADGSNQPSSVIIGNDVGTGSTGTNNVMIGAGNTGDSAQHTFSVAIGSGAGRETLGGGPYNLFMHGNSGRNSFVNNSLGIGLGALRNTGTVATPESNLIAIGNSAGRDAAGSNNTYMGFNSGNGAQGSNNFGVGPNTFRSSTGSNSVAIGQDVGNNSTATDFVAIGQNAGGAGAGLVTETVSIGHLAGTATANGLGNVAVGARALAGASAGGFGAVAVGLNAGRNADSDGSVFVGPAAGDGASGFGAVAMGSSAGAGASGQSIISIGRLAGSGASAGHLISIGQVAGQNASGSDLIGIGRFSLQNNTGSRVLALGTGAGEGNAISGAVILGHFELPRFAGPAAAATALPAAPVAGDPNPGSIYIYWDTTDNTLKVRPS